MSYNRNSLKFIVYYLKLMRFAHSGVAQWLEQLPVKQWVVGSSPTPGDSYNFLSCLAW